MKFAFYIYCFKVERRKNVFHFYLYLGTYEYTNILGSPCQGID